MYAHLTIYLIIPWNALHKDIRSKNKGHLARWQGIWIVGIIS